MATLSACWTRHPVCLVFRRLDFSPSLRQVHTSKNEHCSFRRPLCSTPSASPKQASRLKRDQLLISKKLTSVKNDKGRGPFKVPSRYELAGRKVLKSGKAVDIVYIDGACTSNGQEGARAGVGVYFGDSKRNLSEVLPGEIQTNQRAELMSAIRALEESEPDATLRIYSDSTYLLNGITTWMSNWKRFGWKRGTGRGEEVKNRDLWERLDNLLSNRPKKSLQWFYVPGHAGIDGNEQADKLAVNGIECKGDKTAT